jgi:hypothetical protein
VSGERRRALRLKSRVSAEFCPLVRFRSRLRMGARRPCVALEVSKTGLLLADAGRLCSGTTLRLTLRLPDVTGAPIACYATVVRRASRGGPERYAVRFVGLCEVDAFRIERYVRSQDPDLALESLAS